MTGAADRADRRNVVVQAQAIQLVDRGIDDLAAALEIGVLAHFPFSGPDLDRGHIVVETVTAEVADAAIDAQRGAAVIGVGIEGDRRIPRTIMTPQRRAVPAVMRGGIIRPRIAAPPETIGVVTQPRVVISIAAILRRIAVMIDLD